MTGPAHATQKYLVVCLAALLLLAPGCDNTQATALPARVQAATTFINPLLPSGPDPWVVQKDTTYYYTNTFGNRIAIAATNKMSELSNASFTTIWMPPLTGMYAKQIWAPEMHHINNKWYVYFAADDGNNANHRIYALECNDADPIKGEWTFKGKIADTQNDKWAIDASVFEYQNQLYMAWSGWPDTANTQQVLYIARRKDPLTLEGRRVMISAPEYEWEKAGAPPAVNEGPQVLLNKNGKLFLTFSASGCWTDSYSLGLLSLKDNSDPMNPAHWTKSPSPLFTTAAANNAYAPGHNGFFTSRDGKQNWMIYHANSNSGDGCGNKRSPRMQRFTWKADGTPDFGVPVKTGVPVRKPGGE